MYPGSPRFTPRAAGGLGHPPEPSPLRMMRSYDDADILHHHDHSVLVHQAPPLVGGETLPRLKSSQRPRPVAKIIASSRESQERLQEEEISTLEEWKAGHRSQGNSPYNSLRRPRQEPLQLKRNSSFDSESGIPFANEKAGTIRMRSNSSVRLPDRSLSNNGGETAGRQLEQPRRNAGDVLHDIGSMLSDLTDELDAMLKLDREEA